MTEQKTNKIYRILNILQIIFIIISALCIIAACIHIYITGGDEPYSREVVAKHYTYICIPIYITLFLVFAGLIFRIIFPTAKKEKEFYGKPVKTIQYDNNPRLVLIVRCATLLIASVFIVYGFASGGAVAVLTKAVNICTECIGLG